MALKLFDFQKEAVKKALKLWNMLLCVRVGGGKTIIAMVYTKNLLKKNIVDKVVFACTVSAAVAVRGEFKEKGGIDIPQYDDVESFLNFIRGDKKVCVIKHSMFEKLGYDQNIINTLRDICEQPNKKIALIIDEAHKISNDKGIANSALKNIKFCFERILCMTATPYQSCISQMYGVKTMALRNLFNELNRDVYVKPGKKNGMVSGQFYRTDSLP
jgi:ERCC4-related helicase